jgi:hypothetical protein
VFLYIVVYVEVVAGKARRKSWDRSFFIYRESYLSWGPFNLLYNGYQGPFPAVKRAACEPDNSPPSKADDKNI